METSELFEGYAAYTTAEDVMDGTVDEELAFTPTITSSYPCVNVTYATFVISC